MSRKTILIILILLILFSLISFIIIFKVIIPNIEKHEAKEFSNKIIEYCKKKDYLKITPFLTEYYKNRIIGLSESKIYEMLENEFPTNVNTYIIKKIEKTQNGYMVKYDINNDMIFFLFIEKELNLFLIKNFDLKSYKQMSIE
jgi:hypothetical protein